MSKMIEAIAAHRAAYDRWQDGPEDDGTTNSTFIHNAQDEMEAQTAVLGCCVASQADLVALIDHLGWFTAEHPELEGSGDIEQTPFAMLAAINMAMIAHPALARAQALLKAVDFDNFGTMVAGKFVGGNGGLISRETIKAADELRKALSEVSNG